MVRVELGVSAGARAGEGWASFAEADEAGAAERGEAVAAFRGVDVEGVSDRAVYCRDDAAVEALAVVAEGAVAFELARAARAKFGGDAIGDFTEAHRAYLERIDWTAS